MTNPDEDFDLVTHSEVDIPASAATIWPLILDPVDWKQGLKLVHESGRPNELGERRVGHGPDGEVLLIVDTVALDPERRLAVKLTTSHGAGSGYAAWFLREADQATNVSYDVYASMGKLEGIDLSEYVAMNQQRFDAELVGLRELVAKQTAH